MNRILRWWAAYLKEIRDSWANANAKAAAARDSYYKYRERGE